MKKVELKKVEHKIKTGDLPADLEPNITEDCLLCENGEVIGFYIKEVHPKLASLLSLANQEFRSDRVPKQEMHRGTQKQALIKGLRHRITQYSTIIGAVPKKPTFRRNYNNFSLVHQHKPAQLFIKTMLLIAMESEHIIKAVAPNLYNSQLLAIEKGVHKKWRFANLFTSSISNYNISAEYHIDKANLRGAANVILTKRLNTVGGCLNVPDYNATFEQGNNSMIVYPAWRNMHGVTPIHQTFEGGYRNSFIFYALKSLAESV